MGQELQPVTGAGSDGLIEAVGQELQPCGPGQAGGPIRAQSGQWSFRFNHEQPLRLGTFVTVTVAAPIMVTLDLCAEMNEAQVESLRDWLSHILDIINGRPVIHHFSPTFGQPGDEVTIHGKNFSDALVVTFGASVAPAIPEIESDKRIKVHVPREAQTGPISVRNPRGIGESIEIFSVL